MKAYCSRLILGCVAALIGLGSQASAAPVAVKLNLSSLRCIQNYALVMSEDDQVYLTVSGVAKGAEVSKRVPESGTMEANRKKPPVTEDQPTTLWEGELADGEFALLTVALYQSGGNEDAVKTFNDQLDKAVKAVAERSKKTLTAEEGKALAAGTLKAQQGVVTQVTETLSREKKTDHFGGLFNVLVWNNAGTIVKRLDPVGLTFGEHYGEDSKIYSKIKFTRNNTLVAEGKGEDAEWFPQAVPPISEDKHTIRVKMLENEYYKDAAGKSKKNVTDYLLDLQLHAGGKPVEWKLGGEKIGPSQTHMYWEFAE